MQPNRRVATRAQGDKTYKHGSSEGMRLIPEDRTLCPLADTYVVVGYEFPESSGDVVRNRFGQNFELAARTMNGSFKFDSFDTNVIEVRSADVQRFVEQLHYMMDSM